MSDIEIDNFKLIANKILHLRKKKQYINIVNKTFINRYYYYIFHKYLEFFNNNLLPKRKNEIDNYKSNIHFLIMRTLKGLQQHEKTWIYYTKLRTLRNSSDYNLSAQIGDYDVNDVKDKVSYLETQLHYISPSDLNVAFDKALAELSKLKRSP